MDKEDFFAHLDGSFFRMLVEALSHEIFVCDAQGKIIYLNPASEYLISRKKENVVGRNISDLVADGSITASVTLEVLQKRGICTIIQGVDNSRNLLTIGIPVFDENATLRYVLTSSQDVEEVIHLNDDLLRKNQELRDRMKHLEHFKSQYFSTEGLIYVGDSFENIVKTITRVAPLDVNILILGETGVGKEGIAKMVHQMSQRKNHPYIKINCGMIPENLFESELFGYEEGAFTGAIKGGKPGKVELSHQGTLFLDEIGELPLSMQVKLLEFLQDRTLTRVGGVEKIAVNTRIVAATNRDLKAMCEEGLFRWDLYYRLSILPIHIPPLREQEDVILHIAQFILYRCNNKYGLNKRFDKNILSALLSYDWPGNIRELEHVIERLYITGDGHELKSDDLMHFLKSDGEMEGKIYCSDIIPLKEAKDELERQLVQRAYQQYGSTYKAAEVLHINQSTVVKLLKKHKGKQ